jgi:hypothetical protein
MVHRRGAEHTKKKSLKNKPLWLPYYYSIAMLESLRSLRKLF